MTGGEQDFTVDPAVVRDHAARFAEHADVVRGIHRELMSTLDAAGACWGDDAAGQSFAAGHLAAARDTVDQLGGLPGRLTEVGDRFTEMAARYDQTEQANAESLHARDR